MFSNRIILFIGLFVSVKSFEDKDVYNSLSKTLFFTAVILIVEGAIGYRQFALGLPEVLVGIHILGATLLWVCTTAGATGATAVFTALTLP